MTPETTIRLQQAAEGALRKDRRARTSSTFALEASSILTAFFERHPRSLPVLCNRLLDARRELLRWDDGEANDFRTFLADPELVPTTPGNEAREAACAVFWALLRRHMRQKGMQASVRYDEDGERFVASDPTPTRGCVVASHDIRSSPPQLVFQSELSIT